MTPQKTDLDLPGSVQESPAEAWVDGGLLHLQLIEIIRSKIPGGSDGKEPACNVGDGSGRPLGQEDPLEEGMATHSSILAWRISWTEEPGRLQFIGFQRVEHY